MSQDSLNHRQGRRRRLSVLAAITAMTLGSLALAGCGNDDEPPPMEQQAPMEEPAQEPPMGDDPAMDQDPAMESAPMDEGGMEGGGMGDDPMDDPMADQEPMMEDEEAGSL